MLSLSKGEMEMNQMKVLEKPLTKKELESEMNENRYIKVIVPVEVEALINNDLEGVLDLLSELVTGTPCLMDISYKAVGVINEYVLAFEVRGVVSEDICEFDEE